MSRQWGLLPMLFVLLSTSLTIGCGSTSEPVGRPSARPIVVSEDDPTFRDVAPRKGMPDRTDEDPNKLRVPPGTRQ